MSQITAHILDTNKGRPAANVRAILFKQQGNNWQEMASATTDNNGRITALLPRDTLPGNGIYKMKFLTKDYFDQYQATTFYPFIEVIFEITSTLSHPPLAKPFWVHNIPGLLSGHRMAQGFNGSMHPDGSKPSNAGINKQTMKLSIKDSELDSLLGELKVANVKFQKTYPGDKPDRQPVHTVYGGANLFKSDTCKKMGEIALRNLHDYAPNFAVLASVLQLQGHERLTHFEKEIEDLSGKLEYMTETARKKEDAWLSYTIYNKIIQKLNAEAVEDFRIDFEDGFGNRPDDEEDATAIQAASELATGMENKTISPFIGIRIKPFTEDMKYRGVRTMDLFLTTLLEKTNGVMPPNFVVMLPKVTIPEQMTTMVKLLEMIEGNNKLAPGTLKVETMVEATQIILDDEGRNPLLRIVKAGEGRCVAAHFGTYDYTASCGITARYQTMSHPVCDFAHHMTKVALGGTGIFLSDGATNVIPVGPHRGESLSYQQLAENRESVHNAWRMGFNHTMHSLINGFYQGWDLNPAQLPMRYAATYNFFLSSYEDAVVRLKTFVERAAVSTLTGDIFDDAATGQGLLNFFLRAMNCGAVSEEEALVTGLTLDEIHSRSFYHILAGRRKRM